MALSPKAMEIKSEVLESSWVTALGIRLVKEMGLPLGLVLVLGLALILEWIQVLVRELATLTESLLVWSLESVPHLVLVQE